MLAGVALLAAGRRADDVAAAGVHRDHVAGFVLMLFGRTMLRRIWFPLAYLLLGLPIWDASIGWLQPPSQILSARVAAVILHPIGIPVLRDGTRVVLPNVTLEVMRECSGVNQLFAIVAMALPAAYLLLGNKLSARFWSVSPSLSPMSATASASPWWVFSRTTV